MKEDTNRDRGNFAGLRAAVTKAIPQRIRDLAGGSAQQESVPMTAQEFVRKTHEYHAVQRQLLMDPPLDESEGLRAFDFSLKYEFQDEYAYGILAYADQLSDAMRQGLDGYALAPEDIQFLDRLHCSLKSASPSELEYAIEEVMTPDVAERRYVILHGLMQDRHDRAWTIKMPEQPEFSVMTQGVAIGVADDANEHTEIMMRDATPPPDKRAATVGGLIKTQESNMSNSNTEPTRFRMVYIIDVLDDKGRVDESREIGSIMDEIKTFSARLPKYWSVSEDDRDFIARLHQNALSVGQTMVAFGLDEAVSPELAAHRIGMLSEIAHIRSNTRWILESCVVECANAVGGQRDDVRAQLAALVAPTNHAPSARP